MTMDREAGWLGGWVAGFVLSSIVSCFAKMSLNYQHHGRTEKMSVPSSVS